MLIIHIDNNNNVFRAICAYVSKNYPVWLNYPIPFVTLNVTIKQCLRQTVTT